MVSYLKTNKNVKVKGIRLSANSQVKGNNNKKNEFYCFFDQKICNYIKKLLSIELVMFY